MGKRARSGMSAAVAKRPASAAVAKRPAAAAQALPRGGGATVCVTGAAGYLGSWLVKLCLERGHKVRACVRNVADDRKVGFLKAMPEFEAGRLTIHAADMTAPGAYDEVFEGAHTVFHPAEVFMSFTPGKDIAAAEQDLGARNTDESKHRGAMTSSRYTADSIQGSGSVKQLIYTSSIESMKVGNVEAFEANQVIDETRFPDASVQGEDSYAVTKRKGEVFFAEAAAKSGGAWRCLIGCPGDIIGPIVGAHQAPDCWQGKVSGILRGEPTTQENHDGRPWMTVDVRDVAEAHLRLAESPLESGTRLLVTSTDKIPPESVGPRIMELFPEYDCPADVDVRLVRSHPIWMRVQPRNDRVVQELGMKFRQWDETLGDTVKSLVSIGGVQPKLRN